MAVKIKTNSLTYDLTQGSFSSVKIPGYSSAQTLNKIRIKTNDGIKTVWESRVPGPSGTLTNLYGYLKWISGSGHEQYQTLDYAWYDDLFENNDVYIDSIKIELRWYIKNVGVSPDYFELKNTSESQYIDFRNGLLSGYIDTGNGNLRVYAKMNYSGGYPVLDSLASHQVVIKELVYHSYRKS